jgi:hypothetical protein
MGGVAARLSLFAAIPRRRVLERASAWQMRQILPCSMIKATGLQSASQLGLQSVSASLSNPSRIAPISAATAVFMDTTRRPEATP